MSLSLNKAAEYFLKFYYAAKGLIPERENIKSLSGGKIEIEGEISYPIPIKGIQPVSLGDILKPNQERIDEIIRLLGLRTLHPKYNERNLILKVINNFAAYVHLLPASEDHHHQTPGGLLAHSLDVALGALKIASSKDLMPKGYPDEEAIRKECYRYAVFVSGLLHDVGKVFSDMRVLSTHDGCQWQPRIEPLTTWAVKNKVERYKVEWLPERVHKKHESVSTYVMNHILPVEAKEYLLECKLDDMFHEIDSAIGFYAERKGFIYDSVRQADSISTARSFSGDTDPMLGHRIMSLSSQIIRAIHRNRNKWRINENSGEVWVVHRQVFLTHPLTIEHIRDDLIANDVATPADVTVLMNIMLEQHIVANPDPNSRLVFWLPGEFTPEEAYRIQQASINGTDNSLWLPMYRLKWYSYYFGDMPLPDSAPGIMSLNKDSHMILYSNNADPLDMPAPKAKAATSKPSIAGVLSPGASNVNQSPALTPSVQAVVNEQPKGEGVVTTEPTIEQGRSESASSQQATQSNTQTLKPKKSDSSVAAATTKVSKPKQPKKSAPNAPGTITLKPAKKEPEPIVEMVEPVKESEPVAAASSNSDSNMQDMIEFIQEQSKQGVMLIREFKDGHWVNITRMSDFSFKTEADVIGTLKDIGFIVECSQRYDPLAKKAFAITHKRGGDTESLLSEEAITKLGIGNDGESSNVDGFDIASMQKPESSMMQDQSSTVYSIIEKAKLLNIITTTDDVIEQEHVLRVRLGWIREVMGNQRTGLDQAWIDSVKVMIGKKAYIEITKR